MNIQSDNGSISLSSFWLVKLRWIAIAAISLFLIIAKITFGKSFAFLPVLLILVILVMINLYVAYYLRSQKENTAVTSSHYKTIDHFQIIADIVLFSVILHYSGGIENPFIAIYLLHVVLAGIFLPLKECIIVTIVTNFLLGLVVVLEYSGIIEHYQLGIFASQNNYQNEKFVFLTGFVFTIISFALVYLTNTITKQLRLNQNHIQELNEELTDFQSKSNKYILALLQKIRSHYDTCSKDVKKSDTNLSNFKTLLDDLKTLIELRKNTTFNTEKFQFVEMVLDVFDVFRKSKRRSSLTSTNGNFIALIKDKNSTNNGIAIPVSYSIDKNINQIEANKSLIQSLLFHLLHNAIKFNSSNGQVYFNAKSQNRKLRIEIYDTGIGINKKDQKNIFEEFYTENNPVSQKQLANGLGLTLVKEICDSHHGKIRINSRKGKGTKINIELPVLVND